MFPEIAFAIFLFILCAMLFVLEVYIPSFGLITVIALICLGCGIGIFFHHGENIGKTGLYIAIFLIPIVGLLTYFIFPKTGYGKMIIMRKVIRSCGDAIPDLEELKSVQDKKGIVISALRPVGVCDFNGKRIICVAEAGFVEKDTPIQVIGVEGNKVTVRTIEKET